jgi:hypothetical protein
MQPEFGRSELLDGLDVWKFNRHIGRIRDVRFASTIRFRRDKPLRRRIVEGRFCLKAAPDFGWSGCWVVA